MLSAALLSCNYWVACVCSVAAAPTTAAVEAGTDGGVGVVAAKRRDPAAFSKPRPYAQSAGASAAHTHVRRFESNGNLRCLFVYLVNVNGKRKKSRASTAKHGDKRTPE